MNEKSLKAVVRATAYALVGAIGVSATTRYLSTISDEIKRDFAAINTTHDDDWSGPGSR